MSASSFPFRDPLFNMQWLRAVGHASAGGAEFGECLAIARRIADGDLASWHAQWAAAGEALFAVGLRERAARRHVSARGAFLRAANYIRTAGLFLLGSPHGEAAASCDRRQRESFAAAAALADTPAAEIVIPFEGTPLRGWFFAAGTARGRRPTLIVNGGYDSSAEECWFYGGAAGVARGFNVICFDGPGQGSALLQRGLTMRPDWDAVIGRVIDVAAARDDVDATRIALMGISFGGHLALRAASAESRLAACVLDPGQYSLFDEFLARVPKPLRDPVRRGAPWARAVLRAMLRRRQRHPTRGWTLRRGAQVHGVADASAYVDDARRYTLEGRIASVRCPTLVCRAELDIIGTTASRVHDELATRKDWIEFQAADGAGEHCEAAARAVFETRAFAWLERVLA